MSPTGRVYIVDGNVSPRSSPAVEAKTPRSLMKRFGLGRTASSKNSKVKESSPSSSSGIIEIRPAAPEASNEQNMPPKPTITIDPEPWKVNDVSSVGGEREAATPVMKFEYEDSVTHEADNGDELTAAPVSVKVENSVAKVSNRKPSARRGSIKNTPVEDFVEISETSARAVSESGSEKVVEEDGDSNADDDGVMTAMEGTAQGNTGWYHDQTNKGLVYYFSVNEKEAWTQLVGPLLPAHWRALREEVKTATRMVACPGSTQGASGLYLNKRMQVSRWEIGGDGTYTKMALDPAS